MVVVIVIVTSARQNQLAIERSHLHSLHSWTTSASASALARRVIRPGHHGTRRNRSVEAVRMGMRGLASGFRQHELCASSAATCDRSPSTRSGTRAAVNAHVNAIAYRSSSSSHSGRDIGIALRVANFRSCRRVTSGRVSSCGQRPRLHTGGGRCRVLLLQLVLRLLLPDGILGIVVKIVQQGLHPREGDVGRSQVLQDQQSVQRVSGGHQLLVIARAGAGAGAGRRLRRRGTLQRVQLLALPQVVSAVKGTRGKNDVRQLLVADVGPRSRSRS